MSALCRAFTLFCVDLPRSVGCEYFVGPLSDCYQDSTGRQWVEFTTNEKAMCFHWLISNNRFNDSGTNNVPTWECLVASGKHDEYFHVTLHVLHLKARTTRQYFQHAV